MKCVKLNASLCAADLLHRQCLVGILVRICAYTEVEEVGPTIIIS